MDLRIKTMNAILQFDLIQIRSGVIEPLPELFYKLFYEVRYSPDQPRGDDGRWIMAGGSGSGGSSSNYAKAIDIFNDNDLTSSDVTAQDIIDELGKSAIGRETLKGIENLPERIQLTYGIKPDVRGEEIGGQIYIYVNNCRNIQWVARTVIHEYTHYRYGIGHSQWSESVCIAQELKHARNRDYLTIAEKRTIIKAVKSDSDYKKLNWRKGGTINGRIRSH